jgi:predicted ArsR family transcriptional regulator
LTSDQEKLLELVKAEKEIGIPEAATRLGLTEKQLQENFTVLRHMELLRAAKKGDGKVIALF